MSEMKYRLEDYPLMTSFKGISWIGKLRDLSKQTFISVEEKTVNAIETRGVMVGHMDDYRIYFLTSRPRIRIVPEVNGSLKKNYIYQHTNSNGYLECSFTLQADMPDNVKAPKAKARLILSEELNTIIREAGKTKSEIQGVYLAEDFANAMVFEFSDKSISSVAMNLVPDLNKFIEIVDESPNREFLESLCYEIQYIGQATTFENRLNAHNKIRELADLLLTRRLDHEPVIFSYTFSCDSDLDNNLKIDLLEATLISHFKPRFNIDMINFPDGKSPNEISLIKRIKAQSISKVSVDAIGCLYKENYCQRSLRRISDAYGITFDQAGNLFANSGEDISLNLPR